MSQLISVRVPKPLLKDLRENAKKNYYLDLSEYIRSIIRSKALEYNYPYKSEIAQLHKSVLSRESEKKQIAKKELLEELKKFLGEYS